ncbi:ABC transporter ATP-binding protein [Thermodesulfobacteriota bacterium]
MLQVENIDVFHGNLQALWGISLDVGDGELVSLIGANGAGKSTIVETISGLLKPEAGSISFNGIRLDKEPAHRIVELGVCLIPEGKGIFPGMSVLENLEMGAFLPKNRNERDTTFEFVYNMFSVLKERKDQAAGTLSGGEQQMLAIGRALMSKPKLLMCDEPSLGIAPIIVKSIFNVLQEINKAGVSILLVEQNVKAALGLSKRAHIIENGRAVGCGDSKDLLNDKRVKEAYLGTS